MEFNNLEQSIKQIPATIVNSSAKCARKHRPLLVNRLAAAVVQADRALQGTQELLSFYYFFDQQVKLLVDDPVKASGQIGIVRTQF